MRGAIGRAGVACGDGNHLSRRRKCSESIALRMPRPIRILLVDDHPLYRAGVASVLRSEPAFVVCAEAVGIQDALALAESTAPDVTVVDLMLAEGDGLQLVRELRQRHPELRVVVLSMLDRAAYEPKALAAGAAAFISKREGPEAVVEGLRLALNSSHATRLPVSADGIALLSERELQVFRELGRGLSTAEVAVALGVSVKTVETHRESIKLKLGLPHANALVVRAAVWVHEQGLAG